MKEAVLVIDVQNDYFKGGKWELHESEKAAEVASRLIQQYREANTEIIYIQHFNEQQNAAFFEKGTPGSDIHESVKPLESERVFIKHVPNSFYQTDLDDYLKTKGITKLIICGMMSHMCVDTTVRAAKDFGYQVDLVANACATKDLRYKDELLPAALVQKVFMASLDGLFARVYEMK